jgi:hypothetical protein
MFGRTYVRSCSNCWKEWRFKSEKEVEAFETGCRHGCPQCGGYLSISPLPTWYIPTPPINLICKDTGKVLYKCDHRACERCNGECDHTTDIRHAKNFEVIADGTLAEK